MLTFSHPARTLAQTRERDTLSAAAARPSPIVSVLALAITALAVVATAVGLFWTTGDGTTTFTTARGQVVELYGRGLYRYDTVFAAAGYRGTDAVTLALGVPFLLGARWWYRRGARRGTLLLIGALSYFLYVYLSLAVGAAYNALFLVYVALFAASFFALAVLMATFPGAALTAEAAPHLPRRSLVAFMFASGLITSFVWLEPLVTGWLRGAPPKLLDSYTTLVTSALDLALITPSVFLSGALIWRRQPLGYLLAAPLLGIVVLLGPSIAAATYSQVQAGVAFTRGEIIGPISGFLVLAVLAIGLLVRLLRAVPAADHES